MVYPTAALALALLVGAPSAGWAQVQSGGNVCFASATAVDDRIAACSALIEANQSPKPVLAMAYLYRGKAYASKELYDLAYGDYSNALTLDPANAPALQGRGNIGVFKGLYDEAASDYTLAIEADPKFWAAYRERGIVRVFQGNYADAVSDLQRSLKLHGEPYGALWLQIARLRSGATTMTEFAANAAAFDRAIWPGPVLDLYLGKAAAAQVLAAATAPDQKCEAIVYVAEWQLAMGQTADAQRGFTQALGVCPKDFVEYQAATAELNRLRKP